MAIVILLPEDNILFKETTLQQYLFDIFKHFIKKNINSQELANQCAGRSCVYFTQSHPVVISHNYSKISKQEIGIDVIHNAYSHFNSYTCTYLIHVCVYVCVCIATTSLLPVTPLCPKSLICLPSLYSCYFINAIQMKSCIMYSLEFFFFFFFQLNFLVIHPSGYLY